MDNVLHYFPLVLYILGTILLIVLIILGIKLIGTVNKTNDILEDAYNKTKSLNRFFNAIDTVTDTLSSISDSIVANVTSFIGKMFHKKKKKTVESEENEDE